MGEKTESYTFRIPVELRKKLEIIAEREGRSLSNLIIYYLSASVRKDGV